MLMNLMIWYSESSTNLYRVFKIQFIDLHCTKNSSRMYTIQGVQNIVQGCPQYRVSKINFKDVHYTGCPRYSSRIYTVQGVQNIVQECKLYRVYKIQLKNENCTGCPKYSYERQPFVQCKQTHLTEIVNLITVQYNYLLCINIKCTYFNVVFLLHSFLVITV